MSQNKVVYFTAPWCQPCKRLAPKAREYEHRGVKVDFVNIDTPEGEKTAMAHQVLGVPSLAVEGTPARKIDSLSALRAFFQDVIDTP